MKIINLSCLLMDNREILFEGRSLGFFTKEQINKYTTDVIETKDHKFIEKPKNDKKRTIKPTQ